VVLGKGTGMPWVQGKFPPKAGLPLRLFGNTGGSYSSHKCKGPEIQSKCSSSDSYSPKWWNPSLADGLLPSLGAEEFKMLLVRSLNRPESIRIR